MLEHYLQREIVYALAFVPEARFRDLKPSEIENKLFTYHLKKVLNAGYISKTPEGTYTLTPAGRRLSTGAKMNNSTLLVERPLSVLLLVIRRKTDGAWLLYTRQTHPMIGFTGFMHCQPDSVMDSTRAAKLQCQAKTGLVGDFTPLGGGYIRVRNEESLESFIHFTLLYCDDIQGELNVQDKQASYEWALKPDFDADTMFPSTSALKQAYDDKQPFFLEQACQI